jgi:ATP-binding cassette subfamily D (ALD) long-chain fatty acid import protein
MSAARRRESVSFYSCFHHYYYCYCYRFQKGELTNSALITISTRASLKRYHTHLLTLGLGESGEEWEFTRIGSATEKSSVEKELAELRERLAKVEEWKSRRTEIERELERVWVEGGDELSPPPYEPSRAETVDSIGEDASETSPLSARDVVEESPEPGSGEAGAGDGLFNSSSSWNPAHRPS